MPGSSGWPASSTTASATCAEFAAELRRRFDPGGESARGVHLLTYHRAKGLEFDAVFLPRLDEKELPSKLARTEAERAEERRLLYVGMTRARSGGSSLTWSKRPSPFLAELGVGAAPRAADGGCRRTGAAATAAPARRGARGAGGSSGRSSEGVPAYIDLPRPRRSTSSSPDATLDARPSWPRFTVSGRHASDGSARSCSSC